MLLRRAIGSSPGWGNPGTRGARPDERLKVAASA